MGILTLQRRLREIGRLRIGQQVEGTRKDGSSYTRPEKLDRFRFTSRDRQVIDAAAGRFGGEVAAWSAPDGEQWEVVTDARELSIFVPPGQGAFSQWYETWSAGGCQRRCDGVRTVLPVDGPCLCDEEDPENRACAPHTRLSVIIRGLEGLGVWRLESQGFYAATELAGAVDVCAMATARGHMLPARLRLEQRSVKRPKKGGQGIETLRFVVPVLDVDVPMEALTALAGSAPTPLDLEPAAVAELPAGNGFTPIDTAALPPGPMPSVADQVGAVVDPPAKPPRKNAAEPIPSTGRRPRTAAEAASSGGGGGPSGTAAVPPAGNVPVCSRCANPLVGDVVKGKAGESRYVHKSCPPVPPEDDPDEAPAPAVTEAEDTTGEPELVVEPVTDAEVVAQAEVNRKRLHRSVMATARDAFPHDDQATREAKRHAVIANVTKGRTSSTKDCSNEDLLRTWQWLKDVANGRVVVVEDGRGGWRCELASRAS